MADSPFTSDLAAKDLWLLEDRGYEPLGLVLGNCVYSMGAVRGLLSNVKGMAKGEVKEYTDIMYQARELALGRMREEAKRLGADGIIGVRMDVSHMHDGEWMEFVAVGTAVRRVAESNPTAQVTIS